MNFAVADAEAYRPVLEAEIARYASRPVELLVVDDIADWARSRKGNTSKNPPAMAIVDDLSGQWGIVLRRSIDSGWIGSILSRIRSGRPDHASAALNTPRIFLRHLVLHELAHLENSWGQEHEDDCDAWAFDRL